MYIHKKISESDKYLMKIEQATAHVSGGRRKQCQSGQSGGLFDHWLPE